MEIDYQLIDLDTVVKQLLKKLKTKTILLYGDMGVGKTTLIKKLVKELGSHDEVSSPTFSIVNEYELKNDKIFHFDLYRIKNLEEAYNFGIEDYLDSNHWILIEWPDVVKPILNNDFDMIYLELCSKNSRKLTIKN
ncbi:tRNA threonylcarbamoyladenosine biosynthesis protein TsaE [Mariniflexile rhizosphaerae]|uniref:tRNA (adenosine(37)-N6)-threonylcarbamoyltransferase complex ATPase subunit type 1 TsaE n=1 Tax=unclassified Mariniflexile TaxID=2643887 RepID=UPI000CC1A9E7|nr:tRNA (adenosine(37)-N6)-threonylcarbamoyltransferase complex ATPase subunit type 1 TsaE [Mariniflexile sp. TRM1-10]AXP82528.1 tRNA threonylcarbamoyladenosine biosynthesis protein TsaE [Mariniflexile sp. TRM1-10]PLB19529.1 MAG: ATPase, YjeE family protein [Flavobacteriaceae bacterium FS1-H7996/R]